MLRILVVIAASALPTASQAEPTRLLVTLDPGENYAVALESSGPRMVGFRLSPEPDPITAEICPVPADSELGTPMCGRLSQTDMSGTAAGAMTRGTYAAGVVMAPIFEDSHIRFRLVNIARIPLTYDLEIGPEE